MKKVLVLLFTIVLVFAFSACNSSTDKQGTGITDTNSAEKSTDATKKPKIIISSYPSDDKQTELRKKYLDEPLQEAFPQYDISIQIFSDRQSLQVQVAGGGGPDILDLDGISDVIEFARADRVIPLDDYAKKYGWDDMFYDWAYNTCFYKGKLYSLPSGFEGMVMYYNMDVFNKNGYKIPENVTELETLMADMKSKGIIPISFGNANYQGAVDWLYSTFLSCYSGPEALKSALQGKIPWTDDSIKGAIDLMVSWWQKGYIGDKRSQAITGDDMIDLFAKGKAAMMINGTWAASQLLAVYPDCNWSCDVPPEFRDGVGRILPLATAGGYAINANSKYKDACAEILNWRFTNLDLHYKSIIEANFQPYPLKTIDITKLSSMDKRLYNMYQILGKAQKSGNVGYCSWTFFPADARIYMNENTDALFLGALTSEEYLTKVQEYVDTAIKEGTAPPLP